MTSHDSAVRTQQAGDCASTTRTPVLETSRLLLCHLSEEDAPFILELLNDPAFIRYIGDKAVRSLDDAKDYLRSGPLQSYAQHGFGLFLTILRKDHTSIGISGLLQRDELDDPDLGFAFLPGYRSQGYATEAAAAVLEFGKGLGMRRIVAITSPDNHNSIRLLQKVGLRFEDTITLGEQTKRVNLYAADMR